MSAFWMAVASERAFEVYSHPGTHGMEVAYDWNFVNASARQAYPQWDGARSGSCTLLLHCMAPACDAQAFSRRSHTHARWLPQASWQHACTSLQDMGIERLLPGGEQTRRPGGGRAGSLATPVWRTRRRACSGRPGSARRLISSNSGACATCLPSLASTRMPPLGQRQYPLHAHGLLRALQEILNMLGRGLQVRHELPAQAK